MSDALFTPPGPGSWIRDDVHFARPVSGYFASVYPAAHIAGFSAGTEHYGLLLDYVDIAIVDHFLYSQPRVVSQRADAETEILSRIERSAEVLANREWHSDLEWWTRTLKPQSLARAHALQAVDPQALALGELLDHLNACRDALVYAVINHHRLNPTYMLPLGDFLSHTAAWTDREAAELLQLMQGASPASSGALAELEALVNAVHSDQGYIDLLNSNRDAGEILEALLANKGAVGNAARAYVDLIGYRIMSGYDVADLYTLESPKALVQGIQTAIDSDTARNIVDLEARRTRIREEVPEPKRGTFDELYHEARTTYYLRDEKVFCGDAVATGLTRRALKAAGRALADNGRLNNPADVFDVTHSEIIQLLGGNEGPTARELAERTRRRTGAKANNAPPFLGDPPSPPTLPVGLPEPAARVERAMGTVLGHMFVHTEGWEGRALRGLSASPGIHDGIARVVRGPDDFHRVEPGDVLVTQATAPSYNVLLPMLGAVVTARGGILSHAALVAREFGLPAVVGCGDAMTEIPDGIRVRVDGNKGVVWIDP